MSLNKFSRTMIKQKFIMNRLSKIVEDKKEINIK